MLRAKFAALRKEAGKPELAHDASLDTALAVAAGKACASGSELQSVALKDALSKVKPSGSSVWISGTSTRVLPSDLRQFVGKLLDEEGSHVAFAACQFEAGDANGRELLVVLVMNATPKRK